MATAVAATVALAPLGATPAQAVTAKETKLAKLVNGYRAAKGKKKLKVKPTLTKFAHAHSQAMSEDGEWYHSTTPQLYDYMEAANCTVVGENVGSHPGTVTDIHKAFKASTPHRKTMLKKAWKKMGVGVVVGDDGWIYATEIFCG
ncbi:MAG TPA: CAP domain-containing protein [Actinomycetota bacterium]|nr:CAP domain-containing protein [Actinomycetota bacterium]